jgi:hypothetical protein
MVLFRKKIRFIHIGKCGGSYINKVLGKELTKIHMKKPDINNRSYKYIIFIRNPLQRFISAFNHSKSLIEFDTIGYKYNDLYNDSSTPYYKLKQKIKSKLEIGHPFNEWSSGVDYINLIAKFNSANSLAEGLSSKNKDLKKSAQLIMNNEEVEHICKGIGWYLHNGEFIDVNFRNILFVGALENIKKDIKDLSILLETQPNLKSYQRKNKASYDKTLSELAIKNLLKFYESTDYKALKKLNHYGLINNELLRSYHCL